MNDMLWRVEFYIDENGNEPVKDFILRQTDGAIAEILHVFKLLREFNVKLKKPYVEKINDSGLRELRIKHGSDIYRIFLSIHAGQKFILLHAIVKKKDKLSKSDISLAMKRMTEYNDRN
jgi:phage-related protein